MASFLLVSFYLPEQLLMSILGNSPLWVESLVHNDQGV